MGWATSPTMLGEVAAPRPLMRPEPPGKAVHPDHAHESLPTRDEAGGPIDFVRLIRPNKELRILGSKIPMSPELVHRYVTATLHVRTQRLVVECEGRPRHAGSFHTP
ncbi:MAG: hypothetical protein M3526_05830 [Actinomycetota bacterium]|nr:hypothetical protein [Actinomycetota bacterium]